MSKLSIILLISAVCIFSINCENSVSEANYLEELTDFGISEETAQGIVDITKKAATKSTDPNETGKTIFESILKETNNYVAGRSPSDQEAYAKFVASKTNEAESVQE
ncbi:unnamed protein product [Caenorhabditis angaria]|uniref:SXP/RAL-2 family protein Ani s 5-like cation-binding domain-containing protein n=1 Tax=Caenorhabditis angaria TaxID=860376 RepID=A0A9P1IV59_9PELO|nr:unnamed protein product [Caenorhabditis angaria]